MVTTAKKVGGTAVSMPVGIMTGVSVSFFTTAGLAVLLTWLELAGKIDEKLIGYYSIGVLLIASVLGSLLSAVKIKRRWMLVCCITGVLYYLVLVGSTALFFGGNYRGVGVSGIVILAGTLGSGVFGLNRGRGGEKRYKKYRHS